MIGRLIERFTGRRLRRAQETFEQRAASEITAARSRVAADPSDSKAWSDVAYYLSRLGREEEALQALDQTLSLDPYRPADWAIKAEILERLGRREEALAAVERGIEADRHHGGAVPNANKEVLMEMQVCLLDELGRTEEAQRIRAQHTARAD